MSAESLLRVTQAGLYCEAGDFYIDPWRPVERAIITHAHADHAAQGSAAYLVSEEAQHVSRRRLGEQASIQTAAYGETLDFQRVRVSLHPAGHILGSAQIRVESGGEVWVVSGDYKVGPDPTCSAFEPVRADVFISECTFGLPIYRWPDPATIYTDINRWWRTNAAEGKPSVLFAYSLGKAQRVLAGVDASIGPIFCHGAPEALNADYRASGVALPETQRVSEAEGAKPFAEALIVAPPSAQGSSWINRFRGASTAFASGWMLVRGKRRRYAVDRGFALSDHADWPELLSAIRATGAERVLLTHGSTAALARRLGELGLEASVLETRFRGEPEEAPDEEAE